MSSNKKIISTKRIQEIYDFLKKIHIHSSTLKNFKSKEELYFNILDEALTHTSYNSRFNHERLEFLGDAVLRLVASEYIQQQYPELSVGERSALRAQLVSDKWLSYVGREIGINKLMLISPKAFNDKAAQSTFIAEITEAFIGAIYECFHDLEPIFEWLNPFWEKTSEQVLADPHRGNSKSGLQEWCQAQSLEKPTYNIKELSQKHGDVKRFHCIVSIGNEKISDGWGSSIKNAEKNAAQKALGQLTQN